MEGGSLCSLKHSLRGAGLGGPIDYRNLSSLKQRTLTVSQYLSFRSLGMAQTGPLLEVSGSCHQSAAGLHSFLELGVFFQAHVVAGSIQFLRSCRYSFWQAVSGDHPQLLGLWAHP